MYSMCIYINKSLTYTSLLKMAESNSTDKLVDKIIELKIVNRDKIFKLNEQIEHLKEIIKQKDNQIQKARTTNKVENIISERDRTIEDLRNENTSLKLQISKLTADLDDAQKEFSDQKTKGMCIIEELKRENRNLEARVKQFRMSINETTKEDPVSEDDSKHFSVAKIMDDKLVGKKRRYLVRWEGFCSDDDSWEPADHLNCPKKIAEYEKNKKKSGKNSKK